MSELKRILGLKDAISIVAGSMIGSGIFIVSSYIARDTNSAILLILTWILAGIITILGSMSYGELSSTIPHEGGQYIYLKEIYSEKLAFIYGWTLFLVIQTGTLAAVNIAMAKFIGLLFPVISENNIILQIGNCKLSSEALLAIIAVIIITGINSRGIKEGIVVHNIFTITKVLSIVAIIVCGIFFGFNFDILIQNFSQIPKFDFSTVKILGMSVVGALFASITWNNVTFITSEIKNPKKNIKKALFIGTALVIALYFLMNMIYLSTMSLDMIKISPEDVVIAGMMNKIFGSGALAVISIIIVISAIGCSNGMILTGSRIYYKMARDRLFFRKLAYINRRTHVPQNSLWLQCFWICILILWGNYSQLLDFVIYSAIIFYIITIFGIFIMRKKFKQESNVYRVPDFIPITFIVLASAIILILTIYKPSYTIPGLVVMLLGAPIYDLWDKFHKKRAI